ncbi:hypothetical protein R6Q57_016395, partial [Mikania cordata]
GKMSCLMINDIDAGLGRFGNTQMTVNNQIVVGTLMNLSDNPNRVSIGQDWRESDVTNRIPIIVTGNDFSTLYAPLVRDGRMDKFYWQPNMDDIINIVNRMYEKDGLSRNDVESIVKTFPNQGMSITQSLPCFLSWVNGIGGPETVGSKLLRRKKKDENLPEFVHPKEKCENFQTVESLLESGYSLIKERAVDNGKLCEVMGSNLGQSGQQGVLPHSGFPPKEQVDLLDTTLTNTWALDTGELVVDCGRIAWVVGSGDPFRL